MILKQFNLTRKVRAIGIVIFITASLIVTSAATLMPMEPSEAEEIKEELEKIKPLINVQLIFGNNFMHCLIMFIPFLGPI